MKSELESDLKRLATFPEQNPNPVIEANLSSGKLTYINPAAGSRFPDLYTKQDDHPLFSELLKHVSKGIDFSCQVQVGESVFEQKIYFIKESPIIRIYSTDITEQIRVQKKLSRLASFPELNPTPIIEINISSEITYFNPAFTKTFEDFNQKMLQHDVLAGFNHYLPSFKTNSISSYEIEFNYHDRHYLQRASLLEGLDVIRIFTIDITEQKKNEELLKEKNKDITDSINYAQKIQQALLPDLSELSNAFKNSFLIYQPKDIISGDFYWWTTIGDYFIFTCADCTGHGVPGALMSMIGMNLLSHIVTDKSIPSPDLALIELDGRVRKALKQETDSSQKDGMELALCSFNSKTGEFLYAGAYRPLIIVRENSIIEISPTKHSIGGPYNPDKKFELHQIDLQPNDCIYLFSDGYADQFGGPKGKKITRKRLLELLLSVNDHEMNKQKTSIQNYFESWRGELEQVDDVCMIGIRYVKNVI